jgi:hypothetical protein
MPEYVGDRFHERQVVVAVARERMAAVWDLVNRIVGIGYYVTGIAIVEDEWAKHHLPESAHDPAALLKRIAPGPVAQTDWAELTPIDRPAFTDWWLRTVGCGMAYGPGPGQLKRENVPPIHFEIHDAVLALFDADCEIRHNHDDEIEGAWSSATGATFDTCFVLRDRKMAGVFIFGEED